jgi:hypothetical protein
MESYNFITKNYKYILPVLVVVIGLIVWYFFFKKEKMTNNIEKITNGEIKVLKYFGGDYCPHSNMDSRTYKLITEEFSKRYPNVDIQVYWSGEENKNEFIKANAQFVPTITTENYDHVHIGLQEDVVIEGKSDDELKEMLLSNIYNQL